MNKNNNYQEALNEIEKIYYDCDGFYPFAKVENCNCTQKEVCLKRVKNLNLLQELVDKATPKSVKKEMNEHNATDELCPICRRSIYSFENYCGKCGQRVRGYEYE